MHTPQESIARAEEAEARSDFVVAASIYRTVIDDGDPVFAAEARFRLGRVAWRQGNYDAALDSFEQARAAAVQAGNDDLRARAENGIGAVHYARGSYTQARASYEVALQLTRDAATRAKILMNLGVIANIEGDYETAHDRYQRSRQLFLEIGDADGEAMVTHNLGMLHADQGRYDEAAEAYQRCLTLGEQRGNRQLIGNVFVNQAELFCRRGEAARAIAAADLALPIFAELADEAGRAEALRWRGVALARIGRTPAAITTLVDAIRMATRLQLRLLEAETAGELARVTLDTGDRTGARSWGARALELFEALGARRDAEAIRQLLSTAG